MQTDRAIHLAFPDRFTGASLLLRHFSGALPSGFDYADGNWIEDQGTVAVPFAAFYPADSFGVGRSAQRATDHPAEVVGNHIVVSNALSCRAGLFIYAVEEFDEFEHLDAKAGFFFYFTSDSGYQGFTEFQDSAGERPLPFRGFTATLDQKNAILMDHDRTNPNDGRIGELAL
jgi:hypothetical protein